MVTITSTGICINMFFCLIYSCFTCDNGTSHWLQIMSYKLKYITVLVINIFFTQRNYLLLLIFIVLYLWCNLILSITFWHRNFCNVFLQPLPYLNYSSLCINYSLILHKVTTVSILLHYVMHTYSMTLQLTISNCFIPFLCIFK